jgi:nicotinamidase-related amidase
VFDQVKAMHPKLHTIQSDVAGGARADAREGEGHAARPRAEATPDPKWVETPEIENALGDLGLSAPARTTSNAFTHIPTADKIANLGRKTLLVAGVLSEVAVQHSALSGAERGYDVQVVVDACGGLSPRTEEAAFLRLTQSGVTLTSCASVAGQLMGDLIQSPTAREAVKILFEICQIGQSAGRRTR